MDNSKTISFPSDVEYLEKIEETSSKFASEAGFDESTVDDISIAWCKHRKLQGALGGPVGREWGGPDCEWD